MNCAQANMKANAISDIVSIILQWPVHLSCFPGVLFDSTLSKQLATFPHNHVKTMDCHERGINLVANDYH